MTKKTEQAEALLRDTLNSFIAAPSDLSLTVRVHEGAAYFTARPSPNDYPKVIGKSGSHIKALQFLLFKLGEAQGEIYGVNVPPIDRDAPRFRSPAVKKADYTAATEMSLLRRWLLALNVPAEVSSMVRANASDEWKLVIKTSSQRDANTLTVPDADDTQQRTLIAALGTLLRASGMLSGVTLSLDVLK